MNPHNPAALSKSMPAAIESVWSSPWSGFIPIAAVYLVLGFYQIDGQSLWTDEVLSLRRTYALSSFWGRANSQSPLYFNLLGLWTDVFGTTEAAMRSLAVVLGLAAIYLAYALGLQLFNPKAAAIGAALLATSPYLIWYAQEVRYITLLIATSLAMTYSFHRAVGTRAWPWWLMYGVATLLALFTFMTAVFVIFAHGLYLLCHGSRRSLLKPWIASQTVFMLLFASWFMVRSGRAVTAALTQPPSVVSAEQVRTRHQLPVTDVLGMIPYTFFAFSAGFSLGPSVRELHQARSLDALQDYAATLAPVALLFALLFGLGLARLRWERDKIIFILLWLGVPIGATFAVATMTSFHEYNTRYVALALPAYLLIIAAGIGGLRRPVVQTLLLAAVLSVNGISLANYYSEPRYGREDTRSAAAYLQASTGPDDFIIVVGSSLALQHYYKGSATIHLFDARRDDSTVAANLRELADRHERLWLVEVRPWETDPQGKVRPALDKLGRRNGQRNFAGIEINLYSPYR